MSLILYPTHLFPCNLAVRNSIRFQNIADPWTTRRLGCWPHVLSKIQVKLWTPPKLNYNQPSASLGHWFQVPCRYQNIRMPLYRTWGCLSPLYRMVQYNAYSWPSAFSHSQLRIENAVFNPRLVESTYWKPGDMRVDCIKFSSKWTYTVQIHVIQGSNCMWGFLKFWKPMCSPKTIKIQCLILHRP